VPVLCLLCPLDGIGTNLISAAYLVMLLLALKFELAALVLRLHSNISRRHCCICQTVAQLLALTMQLLHPALSLVCCCAELMLRLVGAHQFRSPHVRLGFRCLRAFLSRSLAIALELNVPVLCLLCPLDGISTNLISAAHLVMHLLALKFELTTLAFHLHSNISRRHCCTCQTVAQLLALTMQLLHPALSLICCCAELTLRLAGAHQFRSQHIGLGFRMMFVLGLLVRSFLNQDQLSPKIVALELQHLTIMLRKTSACKLLLALFALKLQMARPALMLHRCRRNVFLCQLSAHELLPQPLAI